MFYVFQQLLSLKNSSVVTHDKNRMRQGSCTTKIVGQMRLFYEDR